MCILFPRRQGRANQFSQTRLISHNESVLWNHIHKHQSSKGGILKVCEIFEEIFNCTRQSWTLELKIVHSPSLSLTKLWTLIFWDWAFKRKENIIIITMKLSFIIRHYIWYFLYSYPEYILKKKVKVALWILAPFKCDLFLSLIGNWETHDNSQYALNVFYNSSHMYGWLCESIFCCSKTNTFTFGQHIQGINKMWV